MKKYYSFSEHKQFHRDRNLYYQQYIEGKQQEPKEEMVLGSIIHAALDDQKYNWLFELKQKGLTSKTRIVRTLLDKMAMKPKPPQREEKATVICELEEIKLYAKFDGLDIKMRTMDEYKTSSHEFWNQYVADQHQQLSFYSLVYWLSCHNYFTEMRLHYLNTLKGTVQTFKTVRSRRDNDVIKKEVLDTVGELKKLGWWDRRLSREEQTLMNNKKLL
jgi:hypothetical protein